MQLLYRLYCIRKSRFKINSLLLRDLSIDVYWKNRFSSENTTNHIYKQPLFSIKNIIMSSTTFHIRIKKNYAADVIKDLQKMDAVELLQEPPIPEWQKKEVSKRLKDLQKNPQKAIGWKEGIKKLKHLGK
jgi:hypothetical protein